MFEPTSRYYNLETANFTTVDGRKITYKRRRFLPQGRDILISGEVTVKDQDRLDLITSDTLGDPEQFWQIGDANDAMNPEDLTAEAGRKLRIPIPQI